MAKHRKTRKEKKLADKRHNFVHQTVNYTPFTAELTSTKIPQVKTITAAQYPYLARDLTKTFVLSGVIIAAQITLFILLKKHIILIPGLLY